MKKTATFFAHLGTVPFWAMVGNSPSLSHKKDIAQKGTVPKWAKKGKQDAFVFFNSIY